MSSKSDSPIDLLDTESSNANLEGSVLPQHNDVVVLSVRGRVLDAGVFGDGGDTGSVEPEGERDQLKKELKVQPIVLQRARLERDRELELGRTC